jgi:hypothetical protein
MIELPILKSDELLILLTKYMNHVGFHEGIDFIGDGYESDRFTESEWNYLKKLSYLNRT